MTFEQLEATIKSEVVNYPTEKVKDLIRQFKNTSDPYFRDDEAHSQYNDIIEFLENELAQR